MGTIETKTLSDVPNGINVNLARTDYMPTRTGYLFAGWSESSTATEPTYQTVITCTKNVTLYAVWK